MATRMEGGCCAVGLLRATLCAVAANVGGGLRRGSEDSCDESVSETETDEACSELPATELHGRLETLGRHLEKLADARPRALDEHVKIRNSVPVQAANRSELSAAELYGRLRNLEARLQRLKGAQPMPLDGYQTPRKISFARGSRVQVVTSEAGVEVKGAIGICLYQEEATDTWEVLLQSANGRDYNRIVRVSPESLRDVQGSKLEDTPADVVGASPDKLPALPARGFHSEISPASAALTSAGAVSPAPSSVTSTDIIMTTPKDQSREECYLGQIAKLRQIVELAEASHMSQVMELELEVAGHARHAAMMTSELQVEVNIRNELSEQLGVERAAQGRLAQRLVDEAATSAEAQRVALDSKETVARLGLEVGQLRDELATSQAGERQLSRIVLELEASATAAEALNEERRIEKEAALRSAKDTRLEVDAALAELQQQAETQQAAAEQLELDLANQCALELESRLVAEERRAEKLALASTRELEVQRLEDALATERSKSDILSEQLVTSRSRFVAAEELQAEKSALALTSELEVQRLEDALAAERSKSDALAKQLATSGKRVAEAEASERMAKQLEQEYVSYIASLKSASLNLDGWPEAQAATTPRKAPATASDLTPEKVQRGADAGASQLSASRFNDMVQKEAALEQRVQELEQKADMLHAFAADRHPQQVADQGSQEQLRTLSKRLLVLEEHNLTLSNQNRTLEASLADERKSKQELAERFAGSADLAEAGDAASLKEQVQALQEALAASEAAQADYARSCFALDAQLVQTVRELHESQGQVERLEEAAAASASVVATAPPSPPPSPGGKAFSQWGRSASTMPPSSAHTLLSCKTLQDVESHDEHLPQQGWPSRQSPPHRPALQPTRWSDQPVMATQLVQARHRPLHTTPTPQAASASLTVSGTAAANTARHLHTATVQVDGWPASDILPTPVGLLGHAPGGSLKATPSGSAAGGFVTASLDGHFRPAQGWAVTQARPAGAEACPIA